MDEAEVYSKFVFAWILFPDWIGAEVLLMSKSHHMFFLDLDLEIRGIFHDT